MFALQDYSSVALKGSRETVWPRALAATNYRERGLASSTGPTRNQELIIWLAWQYLVLFVCRVVASVTMLVLGLSGHLWLQCGCSFLPLLVYRGHLKNG
jgi:hypothetical protein